MLFPAPEKCREKSSVTKFSLISGGRSFKATACFSIIIKGLFPAHILPRVKKNHFCPLTFSPLFLLFCAVEFSAGYSVKTERYPGSGRTNAPGFSRITLRPALSPSALIFPVFHLFRQEFSCSFNAFFQSDTWSCAHD